MAASETIILIDGMYLLFSSFYVNRNMRTLKGEPTGAIYGFVTRVEALIRDFQPQRLGVAFDSKEKTFRHHMYEPYKAKRLAPPEELIQQIPLVKEYLDLRGVHMFESPGFEADDIIATCAKIESQKGNDVLIFTADKDLFQLVGEHVSIYHPKLKEKLDVQGVKEHFGVSPQQIVDYLSLTGDSSDNIPGVPGIGEKTALKIIEKFGSLDHLLDNIEAVEEKIKQKIKDNLELLQISRQLVDLANAPEIKEEFHLQPFNDKISAELLDFYRKLSFSSLLKRFETPIPPGKEKETNALEIQYHVVKDTTQLQQLKKKIREQGYFAFDLETTAIEFYKADIVGISISFKTEGYYIPFLYSPGDGKDITIDFQAFKHELGELFASPAIKKTGHNLKFDILHLKQQGVEVNGVKDDSMVMSYLLYPNRRTHNLKDLTLEFLNYKQVEYNDLVGKGKDQKKLITVDLETLSRYCIDDSYLSLRLVDILGKSIKEKGLADLYEKIEMPLIRVLKEMEFVGVKIDVDFLKRAAKTLEGKINTLEQEIYDMAGYRLNLNSSQQLGELLFGKMNLPVQKRTRKTKSVSTDIDVLNELKDFPIVARIIDYRTYKKLLSTYLIGLTDNVDADNRVHSSFNQTVTATGRVY
jgi:DNA polymerase-1